MERIITYLRNKFKLPDNWCQLSRRGLIPIISHNMHLLKKQVNVAQGWPQICRWCPVELPSHHVDSRWQGHWWHICCDTLPYHESVARGDSCPSPCASLCCRSAQRCPDEPRHRPHRCQVWGCHSQLHGGGELAQEERPRNWEGARERCPVQGCPHRYARVHKGGIS